ncbi:class I SAM-dependent methyltransferase [Natrononativus amylolyticus]|uniref:class I SAM-dependent methyltransferase n=1 Tax=Natrononativus amylolyticus TaxID=2963434 RepID=UPI0020CC54FD|nr:class I SAM-dependent methyltransferase [Natrononativus amylolyticus]
MSPDWMIDERCHAGEEHVDPAQVARYDEKIPFDPAGEIDLLCEYGLSAEDTVVDFGAGTGVFPLAVSEHCERVVAVDVSETMLEATREKFEDHEADNVDLVHDGFVSYDHRGEPAGFVFSKNALHHLPDFWKVEALKTVGDTLEPGGIFRLRDLVYSFDPRDSREEIESWLEGMEPTEFTTEELHAHFREEFSTYDFLLESMLEETGFEVLEATYSRGFYAEYVCRWRGE